MEVMSINSMQKDPHMHHPGHVSMNQAKLSDHSYQQEEKELYKHLDLMQYLPDNLQSGLTDKDLVLMPTTDLNNHIKRTGMNKTSGF